MHGELVILAVLLAAGAFLLLASRTGIPYPILLTLGGTVIALIPGAGHVQLEPELVLVVFLPPLLYSAAFFGSLQELRGAARPISLLAVGLVALTTLTVAAVAHAVIDDLSWPAAFVLGAIVSPTDPVAAVEIATRLRAPRRLVTIVQGESLVNDSTGLIAYKFAIAAVLSGTFSAWEAAGQFVASAVAGVLIGLAVGWAVALLRRRLDDAPVEIAISLLTPYIAYLPAEAAGASAVLAAVTSGLYLGWRSPDLITPSTRIQSVSFWEILVFGANATLFVLIGLQLPSVVEGLKGYGTGELVVYAAAVCATVIATRFAWVLPYSLGSRLLARRRGIDDDEELRLSILLGWSGMRGAVSLAAALAIPLTTDAGAAFPQRDLIIFVAYTVILVTVVGQGMTLGPLIGWAGIYDDEEEAFEQEAVARIAAARAALGRLDELADQDWVRAETLERMRNLYAYRIRRFESHLDEADDGDIEAGSQAYQRLRRKVLDAERAEIIRRRNRGEITDDMMRRIERDLDLEDARLDVGR
jgi:CPA1 family monovalent cation:H+ antiporter